MAHADILMFCCALAQSDLGLAAETPRETREEHRRLEYAILSDLAHRLSSDPDFTVALFESGDACPDPALAPPGVQRVEQEPGPLRTRITAAVRARAEEGRDAPVVLFVGGNPLVPVAEFRQAVQLLEGVDETIVYAEEEGRDDGRLVMMAMRRHTAQNLFGADKDARKVDVDSLADVDAMLVPLRPIRSIHSPTDVSYLRHEIEREILLGRPHPERTVECLARMIRKGVIPGTP